MQKKNYKDDKCLGRKNLLNLVMEVLKKKNLKDCFEKTIKII